MVQLSGTPTSPDRRTRGKPGRPRGGNPDETRKRILDAAEQLFADRGYDGASVRDVAASAEVQLNAVGYHFGPKEALFDSVVERRAKIMTELRQSSLAEARSQANGGSIPIAELISAYITPFIQSASHGEAGWRNYAALMGRLANSRLGTEIIAKHYDDTARDYIDEFARSLPGVELRDLVEGFSAMVAAMLAICANTGRQQRLSKSTDLQSAEASIDLIVKFHKAGFEALSQDRLD